MATSRRVLLGVTGGVAAYKSAHIARLLIAAGAEVTVVMTESATRFVGPDTFAALTNRPVHVSLWERPGEILHVRLARETDLAIVAPATANVLAKLAHGLADDLLTSTLLEYTGPLVIAPAMHTGMWEHPATRGNVDTLAARGARFIGPVDGPLAHGDQGTGRFAEPEDIAVEALAVLDAGASRSLDGRSIVVTAGPTYEPIDPVRFIGNHSSGKMGIAVAAEAVRRGAAGPSGARPRHRHAAPGRRRRPGHDRRADAGRRDAARRQRRRDRDGGGGRRLPTERTRRPGKLKKDDGAPEMVLEPTPDILAELGERAERPYLVGFAAETADVEAHGRAKLVRKGADLLVANEVGRDGTGFGSETNHAAIVSADGDDVADPGLDQARARRRHRRPHRSRRGHRRRDR